VVVVALEVMVLVQIITVVEVVVLEVIENSHHNP
jgi:hypothetical protein